MDGAVPQGSSRDGQNDRFDQVRNAFASIDQLVWDDRTNDWRAPASKYRDLILGLKAKDIPFEDQARKYTPLALKLNKNIVP